jgi:polyisoprenoid-binding protein YceI
MKKMPTRQFGIPWRSLGWGSIVAFGACLSVAAWPPWQPEQAQSNSEEIQLRIDPAQSKVHWTLGSTLHTVHGTFSLKRGEVRFDSGTGKASGEIVADAKSGESGNDGRDKKMHREVLESEKYGEVVFRPDRIEGKVLPQGSSTVQVHGTFLLHGSEHELAVPVTAELTGDHWKGSAKFSVPFLDWGLKNPGNFFLHVNRAVDIELEMSGNLENPTVTKSATPPLAARRLEMERFLRPVINLEGPGHVFLRAGR